MGLESIVRSRGVRPQGWGKPTSKRMFEGRRPTLVQNRGRRVKVRSFCDRVWDSLFSSIEACEELSRDQRRVYAFVWRTVDVRTRIFERGLGVAAIARRLRMSDVAVQRALSILCAKGFAQRLPELPRRPVRLALNPLLIEAAYDVAKRSFPGRLAS
jgi:hypothetical protein